MRSLKSTVRLGSMLWAGVVAAMLAVAASAGPLPDPGSAVASPDPAVQDGMRARITTAWDDATATWSQILGSHLYDSEPPQINFVSAVRASHCYGLYVSAGPVYCFGNNTVFVSLDEMQRLNARISALGDPGLVFLVAHELGHHVQKITGRFRILSALVRASPWLQRELSLRFELEADCLAGVWAGKSSKFAASDSVSTGMLSSLDAIGDDKVQQAAYGTSDPSTFTHGTAAQRTRWFTAGLKGGTLESCNVLELAEF